MNRGVKEEGKGNRGVGITEGRGEKLRREGGRVQGGEEKGEGEGTRMGCAIVNSIWRCHIRNDKEVNEWLYSPSWQKET